LKCPEGGRAQTGKDGQNRSELGSLVRDIEGYCARSNEKVTRGGPSFVFKPIGGGGNNRTEDGVIQPYSHARSFSGSSPRLKGRGKSEMAHGCRSGKKRRLLEEMEKNKTIEKSQHLASDKTTQPRLFSAKTPFEKRAAHTKIEGNDEGGNRVQGRRVTITEGIALKSNAILIFGVDLREPSRPYWGDQHSTHRIVRRVKIRGRVAVTTSRGKGWPGLSR